MVLNATLWYRAAAWVRQARARPDMTLLWSCCGTPALGEQAVLGRHGARDVRVASCSHCGMEWMRVPKAHGASDWQPLKRDAAPAAPAAPELRPSRRADERGAWRSRKQRDLED